MLIIIKLTFPARIWLMIGDFETFPTEKNRDRNKQNRYDIVIYYIRESIIAML